MISAAELRALRAEWQLRDDVIEKDYALGWMLAAIAEDADLGSSWIFKGGTCLRKCYYETYRFSEDLDFTVIEGGPEDPDELAGIFERIGERLGEQAGLQITIDDRSFRRRRNLRGNPTTEGRIAFRGPNAPPILPKISSTSRAMRYSPTGRCGVRLSIRIAISRFPHRAFSPIRLQTLQQRRFVRSPNAAVLAIYTTWFMSTVIRTCSGRSGTSGSRLSGSVSSWHPGPRCRRDSQLAKP